MPSVAKRAARAVLWPFSRFFDPRFNSLGVMAAENAGRLVEVSSGMERVRSELEGLRTEIAPAEDQMKRLYALAARAGLAEQQYGSVDERLASVEALLTRLLAEDASTQARRLVGAPLASLHGGFCELLAYADSPGGFRAQRRLHPFPGVQVTYADGTADLRHIDPLFAAVPYAHRMLSRLELNGSRILDLSPPEALIGATLSSLGAHCTRLDEAGPLDAAVERLAVSALGGADPFDAIVALGPLPTGVSLASVSTPAGTVAADVVLGDVVRNGGLLITMGESAPTDHAAWAAVDAVHLRALPGGGWHAAQDASASTVTLACHERT